MCLKIRNLILSILLSTLATATIMILTDNVYALRGSFFGHHLFFDNHHFINHVITNHKLLPLNHHNNRNLNPNLQSNKVYIPAQVHIFSGPQVLY